MSQKGSQRTGYRLGAVFLLISCRLAVQDERGQANSPKLRAKIADVLLMRCFRSRK